MIRVVAAVSSLEESNGRPVGRINGGAHVDVCLSRSPPLIRRAVLATGWPVCCGDQQQQQPVVVVSVDDVVPKRRNQNRRRREAAVVPQSCVAAGTMDGSAATG